MLAREVATTLAEVPALLQLSKELKPRSMSSLDCIAARVQATAERHNDHTAIIFEDRKVSWRELNEHANRYANALKRLGLCGPPRE